MKKLGEKFKQSIFCIALTIGNIRTQCKLCASKTNSAETYFLENCIYFIVYMWSVIKKKLEINVFLMVVRKSYKQYTYTIKFKTVISEANNQLWLTTFEAKHHLKVTQYQDFMLNMKVEIAYLFIMKRIIWRLDLDFVVRELNFNCAHKNWQWYNYNMHYICHFFFISL